MKRNALIIYAATVLALSLSLPNAGFAQDTLETVFDEIDQRAYITLERDDAFLERIYFEHVSVITELQIREKYLNEQITTLSENQSLYEAEINTLKSELAATKKAMQDEIDKLNRKMKRRKVIHRITAVVSFGIGVYLGSRYL